MGRPGLAVAWAWAWAWAREAFSDGSLCAARRAASGSSAAVSVRSSTYLPIYLPIYLPPATPSEESSQLCSRIAPHLQPCVVGAEAVRSGVLQPCAAGRLQPHVFEWWRRAHI